MPKEKKDQLAALISSLSKAEKRNFRLFVGRLQSNEDVQFMRLFELLDGKTEMNDEVVLRRLSLTSKTKLTNLKRHLYNQILRSLRLIHSEKNVEIQIREQIDYARILYEKGLYLQARKILERAKSKANGTHRHILLLEVVEFIKFIEERHITRSRQVQGKMENLLADAELLERRMSNLVRLTNLKIKIHGLYITMGHARDVKDHGVVTKYFNAEVSKVDQQELTAMEQIFLHQSYMWYYYILLDYPSCYTHASKWTDLFDQHPGLKKDDPVLYMRGLSYVLATLFSMLEFDKYSSELNRFEAFSKEYSAKFTTTQALIHFMYINTARLNGHIMRGTYQEGLNLIPTIERELLRYQQFLDLHRVMVFNHKIAWLFFAAGQYDSCLEYLNNTIQTRAGQLREDIQCYSRLLHLMAHFELGHNALLPHLLDSTTRFFNKMQDLNGVQSSLLGFFRQTVSVRGQPSFRELQQALSKLSKDPYERRAFQHLDIMLWIRSKINDSSMQVEASARFKRANGG